jgi:hypothetical protein
MEEVDGGKLGIKKENDMYEWRKRLPMTGLGAAMDRDEPTAAILRHRP